MIFDDYLGLPGVRPRRVVFVNTYDESRTIQVPYCAGDACPSFDGKRCRVIGHRPSEFCEPAVIELARRAGP